MSDLIQYRLTCPAASKSFDLKPGLNKIGRNPTNDFRVSDVSVSSFHCEMFVEENGATVRDLESTNGTYIDGVQITEAAIEPGQVLLLGAAEFKFEKEIVRIAIPERPRKSPEVPQFLEDGTPACSVYPDRAADFECGKCRHRFCNDAVRRVGVAGGKKLLFGGNCRGPCELVSLHEAPKKKKKITFFGRLTQTIRLLGK